MTPTDFDPGRGQSFALPITPQNQQQISSRHRANPSLNTRPTGNSPGNMFGGVEQLLRDSSDWAYRDQAQLATGFGNWNTMDTTDSSANWMNDPNGNGSAAFPIQQQQQVQPTAQPTQVASAYNMSNNARASAAANANAYSVMTWMNGANPYTNMMSYDEEEWYR